MARRSAPPQSLAEPTWSTRVRRLGAIVGWLATLIHRRVRWTLWVLLAIALADSALNPIGLLLSRSLADAVATLIGISQPEGMPVPPTGGSLPSSTSSPTLTHALWLVAGLGLSRLLRAALTAVQPLCIAVAQEHLDREVREQVARKAFVSPWLNWNSPHFTTGCSRRSTSADFES